MTVLSHFCLDAVNATNGSIDTNGPEANMFQGKELFPFPMRDAAAAIGQSPYSEIG